MGLTGGGVIGGTLAQGTHRAGAGAGAGASSAGRGHGRVLQVQPLIQGHCAAIAEVQPGLIMHKWPDGRGPGAATRLRPVQKARIGWPVRGKDRLTAPDLRQGADHPLGPAIKRMRARVATLGSCAKDRPEPRLIGTKQKQRPAPGWRTIVG